MRHIHGDVTYIMQLLHCITRQTRIVTSQYDYTVYRVLLYTLT